MIVESEDLEDYLNAIREVSDIFMKAVGAEARILCMSSCLLPMVAYIQERTGLIAEPWMDYSPRQFRLSRRIDIMDQEQEKDAGDLWFGGVADSANASDLVKKALELDEKFEGGATHLRLHKDVDEATANEVSNLTEMVIADDGPIPSYPTYLYIGQVVPKKPKPVFITGLSWSAYDEEVAEEFGEPTGMMQIDIDGGYKDGGSSYLYYDIPKRVYEELSESVADPVSRGAKFNTLIKGVYEGEKVV